MANLNIHSQNDEITAEINAAIPAGFSVHHYSTSFSKFAGRHRYAIMTGTERPANGVRSNNHVVSWTTPYSRSYMPSIRGEAACLRAILNHFAAMQVGAGI